MAFAVIVTVVVVAQRIWREHNRSDLSRALDVVPSATKRLSFTDWREVRSALKIEAGDDPDTDLVDDLISRAYDADLSAVSSVDESASALQEHFGFSPATADWEAYAQADDGATMVLRMPDDFDFDKVRGNLDDLGFTKPKKEDGIWVGGIDLVAAIDPTITPELQFVSVLADQHLVVTSDTESYARTASRAAQGDAKSLGDLTSAREVVDPLEEPAAAMVWTRDFACSDLAMSQADDDARAQAEVLLANAGKLTPLSGMAMAFGADRSLAVSQLFADKAAAKENLRARAKLIVGEAPGRGGSFSDDLELKSSGTEGATVQLRLTPREKAGFVLSAVDSGPVLFATC
ncbi:hypothetical protein EFK50_00055 [Nocardioides marmoriginsengisoli]|uniref:DUF3352 domain-containing protein n=1 Tax=Nocardioides marmoriginsengisoli TaxID=661483 RepID=A0A3N0CSV4_9ACTN|nr:hypothetical protein [Nocardioides marmoriginsengisoli]RNL66066.1 hypothetical protein EFK50_00055 [Nocardioides marmoriginsengisoli]